MNPLGIPLKFRPLTGSFVAPRRGSSRFHWMRSWGLRLGMVAAACSILALHTQCSNGGHRPPPPFGTASRINLLAGSGRASDGERVTHVTASRMAGRAAGSQIQTIVGPLVLHVTR